ncbi:hypothetical protein DOY81_013317 [Sarcophaga bullata]|nr:hypothetical protein DOY81_013317 [Sarcophaga bullata]
MSSSFGGIGSEKGILGNSSMNLEETKPEEEEEDEEEAGKPTNATLAPNCSVHTHQRRFFSSESLNRNNTQFADLNQAHKRNANQVCFGSVSDLQPNDHNSVHQTAAGGSKEMLSTLISKNLPFALVPVCAT